MPNIKWVELVKKKEFVALILKREDKTFIVYMVSIPNFDLDIYYYRKVQFIFLLANKVAINILFKYINFMNVFFLEYVTNLIKYTLINNHTIDLVDDQ